MPDEVMVLLLVKAGAAPVEEASAMFATLRRDAVTHNGPLQTAAAADDVRMLVLVLGGMVKVTVVADVILLRGLDEVSDMVDVTEGAWLTEGPPNTVLVTVFVVVVVAL